MSCRLPDCTSDAACERLSTASSHRLAALAWRILTTGLSLSLSLSLIILIWAAAGDQAVSQTERSTCSPNCSAMLLRRISSGQANDSPQQKRDSLPMTVGTDSSFPQ